jgi:hypothetical protein
MASDCTARSSTEAAGLARTPPSGRGAETSFCKALADRSQRTVPVLLFEFATGVDHCRVRTVTRLSPTNQSTAREPHPGRRNQQSQDQRPSAGRQSNSVCDQPAPDKIGHKLWTMISDTSLCVGSQRDAWNHHALDKGPATTRLGRSVIQSVAPSCPSERRGLRTDVDRDAKADDGGLRRFRWWEAVLHHEDAAPPERSTGEQQRAVGAAG